MSDWIKTIEPFLKIPKERIEALTAYLEAADQGNEGMQAVICVLRNRAKKGGWFVDKEIAALSTPVHGVALKKFQFSSYLPDQAPFKRAMAMASNWKPDKWLTEAVELAQLAALPDITDGATYYHTSQKLEGVTIWPPVWTKELIKTVGIGAHIFYREAA